MKVHVTQGWLEGELLETVTGDGKYYSFKGIPYAEPPVGKLRFKAPQPPQPWDGIRKATEHGPTCPQFDIFTQQNMPGSEDCLYLNVYTPEIKPTTPLPVMFFIHGGGYKCGSGNVSHYGPDFLVNHGVVLATINYRVEALGFLCLDTEEVPGNAGMKDQVAALKWVKDNVGSFGGDPNNITVFGESAGGASTAFHVVSPMSKGLFKRAISMSGSPFCDWSIPFKPRQRAFELGKQMGLSTEDPNKLLEFLQALPVDKLINTNPTVLASEEITNNIIKMYHFVPVIEKDFGKDHFLTEDLNEALREGKMNDVDVLVGYTSEEMTLAIKFFEGNLLKLYDRYPEMVVPKEILNKSNPETILDLSYKIHDHYFGKRQIDLGTMKEFVTYANDATFITGINRFIKKLPKTGNSTRYLYKFCCLSERNIYGQQGAKYGIHGASHLDDLMYLFDPKHLNLKVEKDSKEYKLIQLTCAIFTNFAKYGTPTPDSALGVIWPEYDSTNKHYGNIGDTLTVGAAPDAAAVDFWKSIYNYAKLEF